MQDGLVNAGRSGQCMDDDDDETLAGQRSIHCVGSDVKEVPMRAGSTRGNHAGPASGPQRRSIYAEETLRAPCGSESDCQRNVAHPAGRLSVSTCLGGTDFLSGLSVAHQKEMEITFRAMFLCVVEFLRCCAHVQNIGENARARPQCSPGQSLQHL